MTTGYVGPAGALSGCAGGFFIASDRTKNAALAVRADIPWDRRA